MQIARGLHRVGSQIVNSYLIAGHDGVTIIDAGLPGYWKLLQAELAAIGKSLGDVRALILTHGDTDHIGFAARLHRETGIAAYIHKADTDKTDNISAKFFMALSFCCGGCRRLADSTVLCAEC